MKKKYIAQNLGKQSGSAQPPVKKALQNPALCSNKQVLSLPTRAGQSKSGTAAPALITSQIPRSTVQLTLPVFWYSISHAVSEGGTQRQEQAHLAEGLPNEARQK